MADHLLAQEYSRIRSAASTVLTEPLVSDEGARQLEEAYERDDTSPTEYLSLISAQRPFTPSSARHAVIIETGSYCASTPLPVIFKSFLMDHGNGAVKEVLEEYSVAMVEKIPSGVSGNQHTPERSVPATTRTALLATPRSSNAKPKKNQVPAKEADGSNAVVLYKGTVHRSKEIDREMNVSRLEETCQNTQMLAEELPVVTQEDMTMESLTDSDHEDQDVDMARHLDTGFKRIVSFELLLLSSCPSLFRNRNGLHPLVGEASSFLPHNGVELLSNGTLQRLLRSQVGKKLMQAHLVRTPVNELSNALMALNRSDLTADNLPVLSVNILMTTPALAGTDN
ncbi:hypothetical protein PHMEG_00012669 [Phytophthora megakarya]|uniref:Uncharacterized protein n=1 Tax=Phytophthora megakarya TaxID=4795 RepID=A0A225W9U4_9STRA|nr:hypothetical protein PHMEG_00012669 [Phytophthora megakarya]